MPAIVWLLLITLVSLRPGDKLPQIDLWQIDKIAHLGFYLIFVVLLRFGSKDDGGFFTSFSFLLLSAIHGVAIELLQENFVELRRFDIYDIVADVAGAILGLIIPRKWLNKK